MSTFWDDQADQLAKALATKVPALIQHFVRTATPEALAALVGDALPDKIEHRVAVVEILSRRVLLEDVVPMDEFWKAHPPIVNVLSASEADSRSSGAQ
ncbi:hypothetical protein EIP75_21680 [Aquabacterium soli]|uniref:Uncharacterized protein n=1 Tax=Aquabacterium soli TaxID=2493092 RepID=A0A3R8SYY2_9BURK|nr:hypothetical protein [Aquabacterium soli]RRS01189.1 hypothetical protein EIP75_21680 [Aquabacterium soli]